MKVQTVYIYMIAGTGVLLLFFLRAIVQGIRWFIRGGTQCVRWTTLQLLKFVVYQRIIQRHLLIGPWTLPSVLLHLLYITINLFCLGFRVSSISESSKRAGRLSLINTTPLLVGTHLGFLADMFGISLIAYVRVHRAMGMMSATLALFHVLAVVLSRSSFPLSAMENRYGLVAGSSMGLLILLSFPFTRKVSYEFFLRAHQGLAATIAYSTWRHLAPHTHLDWIYLHAFSGTFAALLFVQCGCAMFQDWRWRPRCGRAFITGNSNAVRIRLDLKSELMVDRGQYINIWIPSLRVSFWAIWQTHPFVVTSWSATPQKSIELLVQPRGGLTRKLLLAEGTGRLAFFSGPHGLRRHMCEYESVLLIANGFGIAALLPYVYNLLYEYNSYHTKRIRLVWQIPVNILDVLGEAKDLIDKILQYDTLDGGYIMNISLYSENITEPVEWGTHQRARIDPGIAPLDGILQEEVARNNPLKYDRDKLLVIISATHEVRDVVQDLVREQLDYGVRLYEMDYQP